MNSDLRLLCIAAAILNAFPSAGSAQNLPTPCDGGACGISAGNTPFVTSGQIGNGGVPAVNGNTMTIQQLTDKAILNWQNFDIAAGHAVNFVQPGATSAALNRIWSADPSVIAGHLNANGQVFLLNQNGILFDNGAQVNVAGLTASTLNITDSLFLNGILSGNGGVTAAGLPAVFQAGAGATGDVTVNPGAVLTTTSGGRVFLFAPNVINKGTISTPDGQTILGAGKTVYLAASTDPAMRGLLIQVDGEGVAATSTVANEGQITAARGNVTLAGLMVNQAGRIRATTSVSANGSVYLVAGDTSRRDPNDASGQTPSQFFNANVAGFGQLLPNRGGILALNAGSVTEVLPDTDVGGTVTDGQVFLRSTVELIGQRITLEQNAAIIAPSGRVTLAAAENPIERRLNASLGLGAPANDSRIYLETGSRIDVSGLDNVPISAERNLIEVELRANELQDAPLLRDGFLRGKTVTVDRRYGTTLTDITPYVTNLPRGIREKSIAGGDIRLDSEGDVITRAGSLLDVSGGSIAYQAGYGSATMLLGADGRLYDIATAPKDVQYVGFSGTYSYTDPKWGVTTTWALASGNRGLPLAGYVEGASAGSITVVAPQVALRGSLAGHVEAGLYQRTAATLPSGGRIAVGDARPLTEALPEKDFRVANVRLVANTADLPADFDPASSALSAADRQTATVSAAAIRQGGFSNVALYANGDITFDSGAPLVLPVGGSVTAVGHSVHVAGRIEVPAGDVSLQTRIDLIGATSAGDVVLGSGAALVTRGGWVNDSPSVARNTGIAPVLTAPVLVDGGDVSLTAVGSVRLGPGSLIDASGGGWIDVNNSLTAGSGGDITVAANVGADGASISGVVVLGGEVRSFGLESGGALSIASAFVTVGSTATGRTGELLLSPVFFTRGGFSDYRITGNNGVIVADGVSVRPRTQNLFFNRNPYFQSTGADLFGFADVVTLPDEWRAPTSVSFAATSTGVFDPTAGHVVLGSGASIVTDPGGSVALAARENLTVLGSITTPGGNVSLAVAPGIVVGADDFEEGFIATQRLLIGASARISARGFAKIDTLNLYGYRQGEVLDGGTVDVVANKGSVVIESGSTIDVSGISAVVDLVSVRPGATTVAPTRVAGDAGSIRIQAREGMVLAGSLLGQAADLPGSAGGSLLVGLDRYDRSIDPNVLIPAGGLVPQFPTGDRVLVVTSSAGSGSPVNGVAFFDVDAVADGGFAAVELRSTDVVRFAGDVALEAKRSVTIDAPQIEAAPGVEVRVRATYAVLGNVDGRNQPGATTNRQPVRTPVAGDGTLAVSAAHIDWRGNAALSGFSRVGLSSGGDIRLTHSMQADGATDFTGSIKTTADLVLQAARIYPTTLTAFTVNPVTVGHSYTTGTVTVLPGPTAGGVPLSAGGSLTVNATDIVQGGVLRAPLGQIVLNATNSVTLADGSLTSVSAEGAIIPFGSTQNGQDWIYRVDINGTSRVIAAPPAKRITIDAPDVELAVGSRTDLSGGGDLYAYEFIAGPGGSRDVLDSLEGLYAGAIVPGIGSFGPLDHQYGLGAAVASGEGVYLSGVPGLADGFYTILPARYALLPGAYAIQAVDGYRDIPVGSSIAYPDGSVIVAGRTGFSGTDLIASRTSGYRVTSGATVRTQSGYTESTASAFFTAAADGAAISRLPADAGQLTLAARAALAIDGSIGFGSGRFSYTDPVAGTTTIRTGRGGEVSVLAPKIAVVDAIGAADGFLQIGADSLDRLGAESLILGARRTDTAAGSVLTVGAEAVELRNTAASPLGAPEIILAATGVIAARSGSMVEGRGAPAGSAVPLLVSGDGALLRVSGGAQTTLIRTDVPAGATGTLTIEAGATLRAVSLILDAAADTRILSGATVSARAAGIAASRINVGDVPNGVAGLHITPDLLDGLEGLTDLALRSYSSIAFYGEAGLGTENAEGMPRLASLALEAGALLGYGDGAKTLRAGSIAFSNASNVTCVGCIGDGTGALQLIAGEEGAADAAIVIGSGVKTISGFGGVLFQSSGDVFGAGTGTLGLDAAGDFTLQAARIATSTGADQRIVNADGRVLIATAIASPNAQTHRGIGGKLAIVGTEIEHRGVIALPAGHLTLQATGGAVRLEAGSRVEAAGVIRRIGDVDVLTAAGSVTLVADAGDVRLAETAVIDLSGARTANSSAGGDAGTLIVRVPNGQFVADGDIDGHAIGDGRGGSFALDTLALADFSDLGAVLAAGGFIGDRQLRVRTGDVFITTGDTVQATRFQLSTDGGAITVAGAIDTRGLNGGAIALWARDDLTLLATASLNSTGTDETGEGGDITLGTVQGTIDLGGGTIDLRGGDFGVDGVLTLRAPRTVDNLDVAVAVITADVRTARSIIVEGVRVYDLPSAATLGGSGTLASGNLGFGDPGSASGTGSTLHGDTRTFANAAASATSRIGGTSGTAIQVRAGIEVRGSGDLALVNTFDLRSQDSGADNWRVDGVPVNLTLRSGGDLVFNASLSDGFVAVAGRPVNQWTFAGGDSASYRLVAGADLGAADPAAVLAAPAVGSGNFILTPGNLVRTGNGNIEVAAAGDVRLGYQVGTGTYTQPNAQASVIYTAGVPADTVTPFPMPVNRLRQSLGATYPTDGGDISIVAGRDVVGAPSNQLGTDWQWRRGLVRPDGTINTLGSAGGQNTTWWIAFERFQQGIGALGGGDVEVRAGRDVTNVSVVVPTNGRLAGAVGTLPDAANLVINGGGDITVNAGRDILSGVFQVDRGQARLVAGGTIGSGRVVADTNPVSQDNTPVYPILVLGDASIDVQARADVTIEAAVNGTSLPVTAANRTATRSSHFYTFTSDSRVDLLSVTGDVRLNNNASAIRAIAPDGQWEASNIINLQVYPPNLGVFAVSGSIDVGATRLFPSANADLQLLAAEDVHFSGPLQIYESDVSRVTNPLRPVGNLEGIGVSAIPGRSPEIYLDVVQWPATPLHGADTVPVRIAARAGNIVGNSQAIVLPKPAVLSAGLDITDLRFSGKNLRATDVSLFQAARDIRFEVAKDPDTNRLVANFDGIQVGGPGQVAVLAGGDIDLGNSRGLVTRGNLEDVRLPGAGADLVVGVGFGVGGDGGVQTPALDAFVDRYILGLDTGGIGVAPKRYGAELVRFIAERRGLNPATLTEAQALAMFRDEPEQVRLSFLAGVVYDELHETALAYASSGSYERGYAAISTLFPRDVYRGDLDLFFSQIKTEQGGDINLLVPGGDVTVGIASPPSELLNLKVDRSVDPPVPAAANLGILALSEGAIRGVAKGSFIVNQARILTLQGGNILLWASTGDIDAGKGAKTASAAPPPVIQTDASGNVFVNPSGAVSGSGIGQLLTRSDITAGYVDLIAPLGEVNAGDAGIRVAGDLNIAALRVVGADNIRVGGSTSGVPTGNTGALSGSLSNASSTNEAGRGAVDQMARKLSDAAAETQTLRESFKPSFITVKLFCVGLECTPSLKP